MSGLKQKTISGVKWSAISPFSTQGISFIIGMILARLLSPAESGITGLFTIFFAVFNTFLYSGCVSVFIRIQVRTQSAYDSVFFFNAAF